MAKGGTLSNLGQALAGYGSALSGNPLYLQNVLIQRQAQQQEQEREQAARQAQVGNAAALNFLRGSQLEGTPETKAFEVNGRIVGQNRAASPMNADPLRALAMMNNPSSPLQAMAAQQAVSQLFPQQPRPLSPEAQRVADERAGFLTQGQAEALNFPERNKTDPIRTQKIMDAMQLYNMSRADATKLVDGVFEIVTNPFDGSSFIADRATGTRRPLSVAGAQQPAAQPAPRAEEDFKPILGDVGFYGPAGALTETLEKGTAGMFNASPETLQARQRQRLLRETLLDAFSRSGRPSNYAQQRIEELLPSTGVFESPARAWDAFTTIRKDLQMQAEEDTAIASDEQLPVAMRQEAAARQRATTRALRLIGDPTKFPRPTVGAANTVGAPQAAVDYLRNNPNTKAQFDAKYGAGAADRILGK